MSQIITIKDSDKEYPQLLSKIYDPPKQLYVIGNMNILNSKCIAIVGTRKATNYGLEIARKLAKELAEIGITIVSGLAEGIDTQAHIGALEAGGKTIAVFGCGIDNIFPPDNLKLARSIEANGALISEYEAGHPSTKWTFPRRNRIIAGLCLGVIMIEGNYDSGAMITAKLALDEGREVFALPGNIEIEQTKGPHWLIKQGAKLIENADDVLVEFNMNRAVSSTETKKIDFSQLSLEECSIIKSLNKEPRHIDDISLKNGSSVNEALSVLSILEIKGLIKQMPGKYFVIS